LINSKIFRSGKFGGCVMLCSALQRIRYFFTFSARFSANTFLARSKLRIDAAILIGLRDFPPRAPISSAVNFWLMSISP
jgi:hypothetical protein